MIVVFGSINIDLVARVRTIPRPGETVLSPLYETLFGGKGANQAIAAARASMPGRVTMAGCIGDDEFGRAAKENLVRNGVAAVLSSGAEPTGCAFITVDRQGENAITVASGANAALTPSSVETIAFDASTVAVFQMEVPFPSSLDVARQVRAAGGRVVWNFAPAPSEFAPEDLSSLLAATDVFVVNEHEALTAAGILGYDSPSIEDAGAFLARRGCICVITGGARGAFVFQPDGTRAAVAATPIKPVDTTGAGDTFVGILANGLDENLGFTEALGRACRGASMACLSNGAQAGMPTREELAG